MMRRGRGIAARWNAASEAARRWRLSLPARAEQPVDQSPLAPAPEAERPREAKETGATREPRNNRKAG